MPVWIDGGPRRRRVRRTVALAMLPALAVGGAAALLTSTNMVGDPQLTAGSDVTFTGQGNGHGRGLGQWGAFGYAKAGWTAEQIVTHYYGGSQLSRADVNLPVTVQLTQQKAVNVLAPAGAKVGDQQVAAGQAVRMDGTKATITQGCGGAVVKTVDAADGAVSPLVATANRPAGELLKFCGSNAAYRGALSAKDGKVFNVVNVEDYVRGVVPVESKVEWADQGGYEALRAQAIAARSYALAEGAKRGDAYNDTQDSQVYGGAGKEDPRTDKAVASTAGLVMAKNGYAVPTEFSSSTGGYTAGGDFTAVKDDGDVVSPYKNWSQTVPASKISSEFGVGAFESMRVTKVQSTATGRVEQVEIVGAGRTVTATGADVRKKLGLRSDWFTVNGQAPAAVAPVPGAPVSAAAPSAPAGAPATTPAPAPGRVVDRQIVAAPVDPFNPVPTAPNAAQAAPQAVPVQAASAPAAVAVPTVPGAPAAPAIPTVPGAPAIPTVPGAAAVPTAPAAAAVPTAPAAPVIPGIPAPPAASVASAVVGAVTGKAAVETAYAASGGPTGTLGTAVANPIMFPDGSIVQSYKNGTIYYTAANGAQVVPSGVAAPATLLNWATAFASGGAPSLPPLPLLNLIPGWGDLAGINPGASAAPSGGVPAVPVIAGAPAAPSSGLPAAAPATPALPTVPAVPSAAAAPVAPAQAASTPLAVPTVPGAPA